MKLSFFNASARPFSRLIVSLLVGFILVGGAATASAEVIDRIVARVNDDIVTFHDLKEAAIPFLLQSGVNPEALKDPAKRDEIYREVLEDQVDRFLLKSEAKEMGVEVNQKEIDQWLKSTREQQNLSEDDFRRMIAGYGMDYQAYEDMIRQNLLRMRVVRMRLGSQVNVSEEDVDREYKARYGSGDETRVAEVRNILIPLPDEEPETVEEARKRAEAAHQALMEGADFADVARDFSQGPAANNGGYLGRFSEGELDPSVEKIVFSLESGETSGVERTPFGFQIIQVTTLEYEASGDVEERRARIQAELQQVELEKQMKSFLQRLRSQAFVETSL